MSMTAQRNKIQKGPDDFLMGIRPIGKHQSVAEAVYLVLKDAIANGYLKPGQRLVEQKLPDKMEVSRPPVREAIKRLEQSGLVERMPVRGAIVKEISEEDIGGGKREIPYIVGQAVYSGKSGRFDSEQATWALRPRTYWGKTKSIIYDFESRKTVEGKITCRAEWISDRVTAPVLLKGTWL